MLIKDRLLDLKLSSVTRRTYRKLWRPSRSNTIYMQTTASFLTRQPSRIWMPVASGSRAASNQFANGAQAADFNWILIRQNWFGSARIRCSRNSKALRRVSRSVAWRSNRSRQCVTLVSRWTASWICGLISARLFRPATTISAGFDNFDIAWTRTIDKDSYQFLCCRGSTTAMSHSSDYLRLHWLLSSESSTPLLASLPISDLATMSAMFCEIYIGSQSVSEYHTRCVSWCSTSSMEQRRHTWLAWSRAFPIFQVGVISVLPQRDCLTCLALGLCLVPGLFQSLAQWPGTVSLSTFESFGTLSHSNQHSKLIFFK